MKKSAIVLAVASALAASASVHAETTFYGRISSALVRDDPDGGDADWDVIASGSRWGVRASEDLGNGISANARLETAIPSGEYNGNANATGRLAWVGLSGGFGEFKIGTMWGPYYDALGAADIFNEANWYSLYNGGFRVNNALRYDSPDLGGFTLAVLARVDSDEDDEDSDARAVDEYQVNARFNAGPFYIGGAYRKQEDNPSSDEIDQFGLSASFDFAGASLAAMYEHVDNDGDDNDTDAFYVTAQYKIANNTLKAGYGMISIDGDFDDDEDDDDIYEWAVGVQHSMSSSSRVWIEYQDEEEKGNFLSIGLRKDW